MSALLLGVLAVFAAAPRPAAAEAGLTGGGTLRRPIGARGVALGESFVAVPGGLDSVSYNPAGIAGAKKPALMTVYSRGIVEDTFSFLGYAQPTAWGAFSAGLVYYDAGSFHLNLSNGTQDKRKTQQDFAALGALAFKLPFGLTAGGQIKAYRSTLAEEASAAGTAFDAGAQWRTPHRALSFGAAVQNVGPDIKYENEGDPLPLTGRAGGAYLLDLEALELVSDAPTLFTKFLFTADAFQVRDEPIAAGVGLEMDMPFGPGASAGLRFGYVFNRELDSVSFGLGLTERRWSLDYGLGVRRALSHAHHLALGFRF